MSGMVVAGPGQLPALSQPTPKPPTSPKCLLWFIGAPNSRPGTFSHLTLTLASLITLAQRSRSSLMKAANSSGVLPTICTPSLDKPLLHLRIGERLQGGIVQLGDDARVHAGRSGEARYVEDLEVLHARFGEGWRARAMWACAWPT